MIYLRPILFSDIAAGKSRNKIRRRRQPIKSDLDDREVEKTQEIYYGKKN